MAITLTLRGVAYTIPSPGESNDWGALFNAFLTALAAAQPTTGLSGVAVGSTPGITATSAVAGVNAATLTSTGTGHGAVISGDTTSPVTAALKVVPQDTQPTTGTVGDIYVTTAGVLRICTVAGSPGTWANVGAQ